MAITKIGRGFTPQRFARSVSTGSTAANVGFGTMGVASGDTSVGGATTGAILGETGAVGGRKFATKFLGKLPYIGKWMGGVGALAGSMTGYTAGEGLGNKLPIYKRKLPKYAGP